MKIRGGPIVNFTPCLHKALLEHFVAPPTKAVREFILMWLADAGDENQPLGEKVKDPKQVAIVYSLTATRKGQRKGVLKPEVAALSVKLRKNTA